eukprot:Rhum_TRINITY_DN13060_c1_g1::Rhum_TRINITY_DN13060_c1_g1_i2::g.56612::m.56612
MSKWPTSRTETLLVHGTSIEAACEMLKEVTQKGEGLHVNFTGKTSDDFQGCGELIRFGLDQNHPVYKGRYGPVTFVVDPEELREYRIREKLPGRQYRNEKSLPVLAVPTGDGEASSFEAGSVLASWPPFDSGMHAEVVVKAATLRLRVKEVHFPPHNFCVPTLHRNECESSSELSTDELQRRALTDLLGAHILVLKLSFPKLWDSMFVCVNSRGHIPVLTSFDDLVTEPPSSFQASQKAGFLLLFYALRTGLGAEDSLPDDWKSRVKEWYALDQKKDYPQIAFQKDRLLACMEALVDLKKNRTLTFQALMETCHAIVQTREGLQESLADVEKHSPSRRAAAEHAPCPLVELELHVAALEDALYDATAPGVPDEAALRALSREVSAAQEQALRHVDDDRADVLRRRLGAADATLREHARAAGVSLAEGWELVLDGDDATGRRRSSAAAAAAAKRGGGGGGGSLDGSPASRRRELGLVSRWGRAAAAADAAASSDAAEAKQRREKELQSGLQEMGRIARQMKESAQRVGEQVGSGDAVIKRNQAAVEDASAALGKQLEKVDKKVLWFGGGGAAGSWMGSQLSFVLSFFTASVMVGLVMAAVVLAFLFVLQVIVMFPSVVVVYEDGSPVNPGLIRRGFQLVLYAGSSAVGGVAAAAESVVG